MRTGRPRPRRGSVQMLTNAYTKEAITKAMTTAFGGAVAKNIYNKFHEAIGNMTNLTNEPDMLNNYVRQLVLAFFCNQVQLFILLFCFGQAGKAWVKKNATNFEVSFFQHLRRDQQESTPHPKKKTKTQHGREGESIGTGGDVLFADQSNGEFSDQSSSPIRAPTSGEAAVTINSAPNVPENSEEEQDKEADSKEADKSEEVEDRQAGDTGAKEDKNEDDKDSASVDDKKGANELGAAKKADTEAGGTESLQAQYHAASTSTTPTPASTTASNFSPSPGTIKRPIVIDVPPTNVEAADFERDFERARKASLAYLKNPPDDNLCTQFFFMRGVTCFADFLAKLKEYAGNTTGSLYWIDEMGCFALAVVLRNNVEVNSLLPKNMCYHFTHF